MYLTCKNTLWNENLILQNDAILVMICNVFDLLKMLVFFYSPKGSDCGLVNVNIPTSGAEIGGAFGE